MACDSLGKLITEALMGLGMPPKELIEIEDAARAVVQSLALLQQHANFSAQNLNIQSYEWDPDERDESLAAVPNLAIPAWVERKWNNNADSDRDFWPDVRVCNLAELESARIRGDWNKCAFYITGGVMRIKFSYVPTDFSPRTHRLWYSPNATLAEAFTDQALGAQSSGIPVNFFPMVSGMAELELISTIRIRAALNKDNNYKNLLVALDKREMYLDGKVGAWRDRFHHMVYAERGNRRGGRRRRILNGARI